MIPAAAANAKGATPAAAICNGGEHERRGVHFERAAFRNVRPRPSVLLDLVDHVLERLAGPEPAQVLEKEVHRADMGVRRMVS